MSSISMARKLLLKLGRGGWTKYQLPEIVFKDSLHNETVSKVEANRKQTVSTTVSTTVSKPPNSSSSLKDLKTTTTALPDEWNLNFAPLTDIGFTKNHLIQLSKKTQHPPPDVQDAIYAFAHDLEKRAVKIRKGSTPLQFFIGVMISGLYSPVSVDYINPEERALQIYLERRQATKELNKKVDEELRTEHFNLWEASLTIEEKNAILPDEAKNSPWKSHARSCLITHHKENVWLVDRNKFYEKKELALVEFVDD